MSLKRKLAEFLQLGALLLAEINKLEQENARLKGAPVQAAPKKVEEVAATSTSGLSHPPKAEERKPKPVPAEDKKSAA